MSFTSGEEFTWPILLTLRINWNPGGLPFYREKI